MSLCVAALLFVSSCGLLSRPAHPVKVAEPANPCPEYPDLLKDSAERARWDAMEEADRAVCLINWVKRYQAVDAWER